LLVLVSLQEYEWDSHYSSTHYIEDVKYMSENVLCWPRVPEMLKYGYKYNMITKLDRIAKSVTHSKRPESRILEAKDAAPKGWIVKREHSDTARHVIFPMTSRSTIKLDGQEGKYRWIAQEMMPLLRKWGEIRVIFVDRIPCYAVLTAPTKKGPWDCRQYQKPYSLDALRRVLSMYLV
jgi:hypothetical protein